MEKLYKNMNIKRKEEQSWLRIVHKEIRLPVFIFQVCETLSVFPWAPPVKVYISENKLIMESLL